MAQLTAERRAVLEKRLEEAEDALHAFRTGQAVSTISHSDGGSTRSTSFIAYRMEESMLKAHIDDLQRQLGVRCSGNQLHPFVPGNYC